MNALVLRNNIIHHFFSAAVISAYIFCSCHCLLLQSPEKQQQVEEDFDFDKIPVSS